MSRDQNLYHVAGINQFFTGSFEFRNLSKKIMNILFWFIMLLQTVYADSNHCRLSARSHMQALSPHNFRFCDSEEKK